MRHVGTRHSSAAKLDPRTAESTALLVGSVSNASMVFIGNLHFRPRLLNQFNCSSGMSSEGRPVDLLGPSDVIDRDLKRVIRILKVRVGEGEGGSAAHEDGGTCSAGEEGRIGFHFDDIS